MGDGNTCSSDITFNSLRAEQGHVINWIDGESTSLLIFQDNHASAYTYIVHSAFTV
jgi:hypothetical protein